MAKDNIMFYIENGTDLCKRLRAKGIIPSHLIEQLLVHEDKFSQESIIESKDDQINHLKLQISKLSTQVEIFGKEKKILEDSLKEAQEKIKNFEKKSQIKYYD